VINADKCSCPESHLVNISSSSHSWPTSPYIISTQSKSADKTQRRRYFLLSLSTHSFSLMTTLSPFFLFLRSWSTCWTNHCFVDNYFFIITTIRLCLLTYLVTISSLEILISILLLPLLLSSLLLLLLLFSWDSSHCGPVVCPLDLSGYHRRPLVPFLSFSIRKLNGNCVMTQVSLWPSPSPLCSYLSVWDDLSPWIRTVLVHSSRLSPLYRLHSTWVNYIDLIATTIPFFSFVWSSDRVELSWPASHPYHFALC